MSDKTFEDDNKNNNDTNDKNVKVRSQIIVSAEIIFILEVIEFQFQILFENNYRNSLFHGLNLKILNDLNRGLVEFDL